MYKIKTAVLSAFIFLFSSFAFANVGQSVLVEFDSLYSMVKNLEPDYEVGGYMFAKKLGEVTLLWRIGDDHEVIRIYKAGKENESEFAVTYHKSPYIVDGTTVLRRFIGPVLTGWRADTVDLESNEYLGFQGMRNPYLSQTDRRILSNWGIQDKFEPRDRAVFKPTNKSSKSCSSSL